MAHDDVFNIYIESVGLISSTLFNVAFIQANQSYFVAVMAPEKFIINWRKTGED